jgi:hypothetical protein
MVTRQRIAELLEYDPTSGCLTWKVTRSRKALVGSIAGSVTRKGYRAVTIDGKPYLVHRLVWYYVYGYWPIEIDHIDRNKLNNKIDNLREVDRCTNNQNKPVYATNTSGTPGIHWHRPTNRWEVIIQRNNTKHYLGTFHELEDAIRVRLNFLENFSELIIR